MLAGPADRRRTGDAGRVPPMSSPSSSRTAHAEWVLFASAAVVVSASGEGDEGGRSGPCGKHVMLVECERAGTAGQR